MVRDFLIPPARNAYAGMNRVKQRPADLILGRVEVPGVGLRSLAIRGSTLVAVGMPTEMTALMGSRTSRVDMNGLWVSPGLRDAHVHLEGAALVQSAPALFNAKTPQALSELFESHLGLVPVRGWLWGFGLQKRLTKSLSAESLETMMPGVPLWLSAADGHSAVLSATLVDRLPPKLRKQVNALHGRVSEQLARRAWFTLAPPAGERLKPYVVKVLKRWRRLGITSVDVMGARMELYDTLRELEVAGRLTLEVRLYLAWPSPKVQRWLQAQAHKPLRLRSPKLSPSSRRHKVTIVGVKTWLDGTLGSHTAALSKAYSDRPQELKPLVGAARLSAIRSFTDRLSLQLAVHAIGDAAVDAVIGLKPGAAGRPIRVEHVQVARPDQLPQLQHVLCSIQPRHRLEDSPWARERLGVERMSWAYRGASLAKTCPLLFGSDAPVSTSDPRQIIDAAVKRPSPERLTRAQALTAMQRDPLNAKFSPRLHIGSTANLTFWNVDPKKNDSAKPMASMVHGILSINRSKSAK